MRPIRLTLLVTSLSLLGLSPAHGQDTGSVPAAIDRIFEGWASESSPGCALAVGRSGSTVLARAYGMADLEHAIPNTTGTIFEAGSVSKQFTAAAAILLAGEGRLSLDDDIRTYLPEVPDYGEPLTIRHLIHHTSGLRDWGVIAGIAGWPRTRRAHTNAHALDIISRQRSLNYELGTEYSYTNSGYTLLTLIVERVSGQSLPEFTRRNFFEPLGMKNTSWRDDFTRIVPGRAMAYRSVRNRHSNRMPFEDVYGHAALLTTVEDLLIWNRNLESGKVGGPGFVEEMHRRGRLKSGEEIDYAGGIRHGKYRGHTEISHSGSTAGYKAYLTRFPEDDLSIAVLCNTTSANGTQLGHQVADHYLTSTVSRTRTASANRKGASERYTPSASDLDGLAGEYYSDEAEASYTIVRAGSRVELHRRPDVVIRLTGTRKDTFRTSNNWTLHVRRDEGGAISGFSLEASRVRDLFFGRVTTEE